MKTLHRKARVILSSLILIAFFLPSYQGVSGFGFISLAFAETTNNSELTSTDVLILLIPLLLVPVTAFGIGLVSWFRISLRKTFTVLPLLFLFSFTAFLIMTARNGNFAGLSKLLQMEIGFYLALLASVCLPFTRNPVRKKIRRRRTAVLEPTI